MTQAPGIQPPAIQPLRQFAEDFLSALLFFALYMLTGSLVVGVAVAITVGIGQIVRLKLAGRAVDLMQWLSLGLVVVLGTATIVIQSPVLMMLKPSIIHLAIAAVMLRRGWMLRYMPPIVREHVDERVIVAAGYAWAGLLAGLAGANLIVALNVDMATWAIFVSFGLIGAKLAAFAVQYGVLRILVTRSILRARTDGLGASPVTP